MIFKKPNKLVRFLVLSMGVHIGLYFLFSYAWHHSQFIWGGGKTGKAGEMEFIMVTPQMPATGGDVTREAVSQPKVEVKDKGLQISKPTREQTAQKKGTSQAKKIPVSQKSAGKKAHKTHKGFGKGKSVSPAGGVGDGVDAARGMKGAAKVTDLIRIKIMKQRSYPALARKRGISGKVGMIIAIHQDGSLKKMRVIRSSGSNILDKEAQAMVKRALPLPYFPNDIKLSIPFRLND